MIKDTGKKAPEQITFFCLSRTVYSLKILATGNKDSNLETLG